MDVKTAVGVAKRWMGDTLQDENIFNIGLEEVKFDKEANKWLITLGFSRPWNSIRNAITAISGEPAARRVYRVFSVDNETEEVIAMERRPEIDD